MAGYRNLGPSLTAEERLKRLREQNDAKESFNKLLAGIVSAIIVLALVVVGLVYQKFYLTDPAGRPYWLSPAPPDAAPVALGPHWVPGQGVPEVAMVTATAPAAPVTVEAPAAPVAQPQSLGYAPVFLKWNAAPTYPIALDPRDQAWFDSLTAGNLRYQSWQSGNPTYTLTPPYRAVLCAVAVEGFGGAPANDLLALMATEGNGSNPGPYFATSSVGAQGPLQFMPATWAWTAPYSTANINDHCDAMVAASNLLWYSKTYAQQWEEGDYVYRFVGCPTANGDHACKTWNMHEPQARATFRLSRQLAQSRAQFWGRGP